MTRHSLLAMIAMLGGAVGGCRPARQPVASQEDAAPVPMHQEPRHHLMHQTPFVRVIEVRVPADETTGYHVHANRSIGVRVRAARTWEQFLGAPRDSVDRGAPVSPLFDNWSSSLPYTHRVGNADSVPFHVVIGEWLGSSGSTCPRLADSPTRRLVKEGPTAVSYEIRLSPHTEDTVHDHPCAGLTVMGTAGTLSDEGTASAAIGGDGVGRWTWRNPGHRHVLRNLGDSAIAVFEVDFR